MGDAPAIVVDLGSAFTRSGYGGDSEPISTVHTVAGRPRSTTLGSPFRGPQVPPCIGSTAFKHAAQLQIRYPVENRVITSFDDLEFFLHTLWADELRVTIEKYPLLVTLSSLCADPIRERLCEMVMEKFNVPAFYCASPAAMSLYAAGVTSGIVLDSGDAGTVAMPVFQCFSMPYYASRLDVGGRHVNDVIRRGLVQSGYHFAPSAERELLSDMKEHLCFVSDDVATQLPIADKPFMAPDGSGEVKINKETYMGPEVLFNPELIGVDQPGVAKLVENVVRAIDTDIRTDLARTILLAGGSTMFHGFPERLTKELRGIIPDCEFHVVAPPGRKISAWVGGSIIASVGTFNQLWISKREYEETGRSVVHVKTY